MLGSRESFQSSSEKSVEVVFRNLDHISNLSKDGEAFIRAERIPYTGPLDGPEVTIAAHYPVINNEIRLHLPDFGAWDAYTIVIGRFADHVTTALPH